MAASENLRFDIVGNDHASDAFSKVGRSAGEMSGKMDHAAAKSAYLDDALKRQAVTMRRSVDATLALAKSDEILDEVEHRLRDGALEAEFALKKEAEAKKKDAEASRNAADGNSRLAASLAKIASWKDKGGPAWLGPALLAGGPLTSIAGVAAGATVGIAGAAVAGAAALAAFGAVAKPVLSQALGAEQAVQKAQDSYNIAIAHGTKQSVAYKAEQIAIAKAYVEMSPQQIALSKQLGAMSDGWSKLKAAQTPVVAGALAPWLRSVTDLTGKLAPVIGAVSPVIGFLGTDVGRLVNSAAFTGFRDFVAGTGSWAVAATGGTVIDFVKSFLILLPKFNPLIGKAIGGIGGLGPAVLKWSSSKKASDDITKFMGWFTKNGPAVGGLLKNIGGALKALAPGLGPASVTEMNLISGFFGLIAKLPSGVAKPLLDVAGVLLTLNKLGVVGVGIKVLGLGGGAGGAAGAAGEAAAGGAAAGLWSRLLPGVRLAGGVLAATLVVSAILKGTSTGPGKNAWDNPFGADPKSKDPAKQGVSTWAGLGHDIEHIWDSTRHGVAHTWDLMRQNARGNFDKMRHEDANIFDGLRHDISHIWDLTWHNTVDRLSNGLNDTDRLLGRWEHNVAHWFDTARHDVSHSWDLTWSSTVGRAQRGVADAAHWIGTLPGKITGIFKDAGSWLVNTGRSLIGGLISGITSTGAGVWSAISGLIPGGGLVSKAWHSLGFAGGTNWAPAGWAWVGERGPELMHFRGGEQVMPAGASAAAAAARGGGVTYIINVHPTPLARPADIGREIVGAIGEHEKRAGKGWRTP